MVNGSCSGTFGVNRYGSFLLVSLQNLKEKKMEMVQLCLYLIAAYLIFAKPEKEKLAYRITCLVVLSAVFVFLMATNAMLLPGVNY